MSAQNDMLTPSSQSSSRSGLRHFVASMGIFFLVGLALAIAHLAMIVMRPPESEEGVLITFIFYTYWAQPALWLMLGCIGRVMFSRKIHQGDWNNFFCILPMLLCGILAVLFFFNYWQFAENVRQTLSYASYDIKGVLLDGAFCSGFCFLITWLRRKFFAPKIEIVNPTP